MPFTTPFKKVAALGLFNGRYLGLTNAGSEISGKSGYERYYCTSSTSSGKFSTSTSGSEVTVYNGLKIKMAEATGSTGFGTVDGICLYPYASGSQGALFTASTSSAITILTDEMPKFSAEALAVTIT